MPSIESTIFLVVVLEEQRVIYGRSLKLEAEFDLWSYDDFPAQTNFWNVIKQFF
jgi:hypothetical protein